MKKKRNRAVFLDRDGTLLRERGYLSDPKKLRFYPSVFEGLKRLQKNGFKLVVITNQSGVARGYFSLATLKKINARFQLFLKKRGILIAGIYFCPHLPNAGCRCRKPKPFLALKAARQLGIDVKRSYVIGDQARDVEMARRLEAHGILVLTGAGRQYRREAIRKGSLVSKNLDTASRWILKRDR
jgi:histidinol-phosphate phosphatase family protein